MRWHNYFFVFAVQASLYSGGTGALAEPLPEIGPAPQFSLINQNGRGFGLAQLRGQVAVVTFIFTSCSESCPLLTAKLVAINSMLGADASNVKFVAISVDPMNDTPEVLKRYAQLYSAPEDRFTFLTGDFNSIQTIVNSYGAYFHVQDGPDVSHTFLTSIVDQSGMLRVQYLGWRFDPEEFIADLKSLIEEGEQV